jgi:succinate dehydrogenase / fumarate reductase cytochrome b subunit
MTWISTTLKSSIGKKTLVALSGALLSFFILVHFLGNVTIYWGTHIFSAYAEKLHGLGIVLVVWEIFLLAAFIIHLLAALYIFFENFRARPVRYSVKNNAGGRTWGSKTMPFTGPVIFLFIIIHLKDFHFAPKPGLSTDIIRISFSSPARTLFYVCAIIALVLHLSHGFWSIFQTLGLEHPKYTPPIKKIAVYSAVAIGFVFAGIPALTLFWPHLLFR